MTFELWSFDFADINTGHFLVGSAVVKPLVNGLIPLKHGLISLFSIYLRQDLLSLMIMWSCPLVPTYSIERIVFLINGWLIIAGKRSITHIGTDESLILLERMNCLRLQNRQVIVGPSIRNTLKLIFVWDWTHFFVQLTPIITIYDRRIWTVSFPAILFSLNDFSVWGLKTLYSNNVGAVHTSLCLCKLWVVRISAWSHILKMVVVNFCIVYFCLKFASVSVNSLWSNVDSLCLWSNVNSLGSSLVEGCLKIER